MGDHDATPTCLSAEPHGPEVIRDFLAHYFGCIEIHERPNFLSRSRNKHFWDKEVQLEIQKLEQQDGNDETIQDFRDRAEKNVEKKIRSHAISFEAQYRRTDTLRKALKGVKCAHKKGGSDQSDGDDHEVCNLVLCLEESHEAWRADLKTIRGMKRIRKWKEDNGRPTDASFAGSHDKDIGRHEVREVIKKENPERTFSSDVEEYDLKRDINGYVIQWDILKPQQKRPGGDNSRQHSTLAGRTPARPGTLSRKSTPGISRTTAEETTEDIHPQQQPSTTSDDRRPSLGVQMPSFSSQISKSFFKVFSNDERYLKPVEEKDYRFKGHFPDQRLSLQFLLGKDPGDTDIGGTTDQGDDVVLNKDLHSDRVRYIHIPHNNMAVSIHLLSRL